MQARYFHIRCVLNTKGGATVSVSKVDDTHVLVKHVECSHKDNYDKKVGRRLADATEGSVIPLRYLPEHLATIAKSAKRHGRVAIVKTNFDYSIKSFLPKE